MNNNYTGQTKINFTDKEYDEIYTKGYLNGYIFHENEYVIGVDDNNAIVDRFCFEDGKLRRVLFDTIENYQLGTIKPRNDEQILAIDLLKHSQAKVKLIKGVYGSGKDYLMLAEALSQINEKKFEKLVFLRPNITVGNLPDIGALPGTAQEKLAWTLGPIFDKVGGEVGLDFMLHNDRLEVPPMIFIRGRSFDNSIVYITEGQNMTSEIAKLVLGRIGENSELWINADTHQTDKKIFDRDNGVTKMLDRLVGNPLFGYVYLPQTERSAVARLASLLDDEE